MEIAKLFENEYFNIKPYMYNTEKAVCYTLDQLGLKLGVDFKFFEEIDNIPFTKSKKHNVDLMLTSRKDASKLYVEIKGMMTYLEVNKLEFLLKESGKDFYILQLTELDWITPYRGKTARAASIKSRSDFEIQVKELVDFVNGSLSGEELSYISKQRLENFIDYRSKDIKRWKKEIDAENANR